MTSHCHRLFALMLLLVFTAGTDAAIKVVTNTDEVGAGSLQDTVASANAGDVITFTNTLAGQTITLMNSSILLNKNLTIDGSSLSNQIQIDGAGVTRVFLVTNVGVLLDSLIIADGFADVDHNAHADIPDNRGGAIYNYGNLTVSRCTFRNNHSSHGGGAINSFSGTLVVSNSTFANNDSGWGGAGIFSYGSATISRCTFSGNSGGYGGAITVNAGTLAVSNSTFTGNSAGYGGGAILNYAPATVSQCTMVNNSAGYGGGMLLYAAATVNQSTVVSNSATLYPGGLYGFLGTLTLNNSIVSGNTSPPANGDQNLQGTVITSGANFISGNPRLAPLDNYGGPTPTMPPLTNSPVIDACTGGTTFTSDQRGMPRIVGSFADIGAVEANFSTLVTNIADIGPGSLRQITFDCVPGSTIIFTNTFSGQTIRLSNGPIVLNKGVTIDASSLSRGIIVDGNQIGSVFYSVGGTNVLTALTITNGLGLNGYGGGGIYNTANLTLNVCSVVGNSSSDFGGGILTGITGSVLVLLNSTISGNSAYQGGGIYCSGSSFAATNCTFSSNTANYLGGACAILPSPTTVFSHVTVSSNSCSGSDYGGGGGLFFFYNPNFTTINSIIAGNSCPNGGGADIAATHATISFTGNNILQSLYYDSSTTAGPTPINSAPLLAPLGNYGGRTMTMPPLPGSPAINACTGGTTVTADQRGALRPIGSFADIGAVEGVFNPSFRAVSPTNLSNSSFRFNFTNLAGASFTIFASTNVALPLSQWSNLGPATEVVANTGVYQFTDAQAATNRQRFYTVRLP